MKAETKLEPIIIRQTDQIQIERYEKEIADLKAREAEQEKKNLLLEKSLWACQRNCKEVTAREKML